MNTDSGRIYEPKEMERLRRASGYYDGEVTVEYKEQFNPEEIADFMAGKVVPVSEHVAGLVRKGAASKERKAKRKATRAARRKNR